MPNFMLIRKTVLFFFQSFELDSATYSSSFEKGLTRTSNLGF